MQTITEKLNKRADEALKRKIQAVSSDLWSLAATSENVLRHPVQIRGESIVGLNVAKCIQGVREAIFDALKEANRELEVEKFIKQACPNLAVDEIEVE